MNLSIKFLKLVAEMKENKPTCFVLKKPQLGNQFPISPTILPNFPHSNLTKSFKLYRVPPLPHLNYYKTNQSEFQI